MFRTLLPHPLNNASVHSGEEGRFVEGLLAAFLRDSLPSQLTVATGFIVNLDYDWNSGQTDIIVYDSARFSPYFKYGDAVVVPVESVVAAISVKERLRYTDIQKELKGLAKIGEMCGSTKAPAPYLSLVAFDDDLTDDPPTKANTSWQHIQSAYPARSSGYGANELIDSVIVVGKFYIRKRSWSPSKAAEKRTNAKYIWSGAQGEHRNAYLQELIHSIHERARGRESNTLLKHNTAHFAPKGMKDLGDIAVKCDNRPPPKSKGKPAAGSAGVPGAAATVTSATAPTSKSAAKPATKSATKSAAKSKAKPASKSAAKSVSKPTSKSKPKSTSGSSVASGGAK